MEIPLVVHPLEFRQIKFIFDPINMQQSKYHMQVTENYTLFLKNLTERAINSVHPLLHQLFI